MIEWQRCLLIGVPLKRLRWVRWGQPQAEVLAPVVSVLHNCFDFFDLCTLSEAPLKTKES